MTTTTLAALAVSRFEAAQQNYRQADQAWRRKRAPASQVEAWKARVEAEANLRAALGAQHRAARIGW